MNIFKRKAVRTVMSVACILSATVVQALHFGPAVYRACEPRTPFVPTAQMIPSKPIVVPAKVQPPVRVQSRLPTVSQTYRPRGF